jgi:alpha-tubulin suppressor-like RCC1 family protein
VQCWGMNPAGQLGDGTIVDHVTGAPVVDLPVAVGLSSSDSHTCAVVSDGGIWCWGRNGDGELGNDVARGAVPLPARLAPIID